MGEAKRRGTYEQRKAEAEVRIEKRRRPVRYIFQFLVVAVLCSLVMLVF